MAATYQIKQLDIETGELQDVNLRLSDFYQNKELIILAEVNDCAVLGNQIKILPKKKIDSVSHFPNPFKERFKDEMVKINKKTFSKMYHTQDPDFKRDSYYKYWYKICQSLYKNSNIIVTRKPKLHFASSAEDIANICECSVAATYKFLKDCYNRYIIATVQIAGQKVYVANPKYAINGNEMPQTLLDLFLSLEEGIE